jgi:Xaa-Pro aminopeptidase
MNRHERLRQLMKVRGIDAVVIRRPANFAWNPSVTGAKVEETFVLTDQGPEVVAAVAVAVA